MIAVAFVEVHSDKVSIPDNDSECLALHSKISPGSGGTYRMRICWLDACRTSTLPTIPLAPKATFLNQQIKNNPLRIVPDVPPTVPDDTEPQINPFGVLMNPQPLQGVVLLTLEKSDNGPSSKRKCR